MKNYSQFHGANFVGRLGQSYHFQTLDSAGEPRGPVRLGMVKRIYRTDQGRVAVELVIPELACTHIYHAREVFRKEVTK